MRGHAYSCILERTSERGPNTIGPAPNPATKSERPSVQTSREDPNSGSIWLYVDVYSDDVQVLAFNNVSMILVWLGLSIPAGLTYTQSELAAQINTTAQRRKIDMLRGFSGSASPSNVTKYGSGVTTLALALFGRWLL